MLLFSLFKNWHPASKLDSDLNSDLKSDYDSMSGWRLSDLHN